MELPHHPDRPGGPVYFVGDAHIGTAAPPLEREKEVRLLGLLDQVADRAATLVLMGDLFDFWFEYRHAIPSRGFAVLSRLRTLTEAGLPVLFLGGNHDWWAAPFLSREVGLHCFSEPIRVACQGRDLFLAHGDGLAPGDQGYRVLRRVLRNRLAIAAYRWIHPDFGIPFATHSSHTSRRHTEARPVVGTHLWSTIAVPQFDAGANAVVIGHFHRPVHVRGGGRDFIIGGDWMGHWTYTTLEGGVFSLRSWPGAEVHPAEQITI